MISETSKIRNEVIAYCKGNGLDLGSGGDKIAMSAMGVDIENPYTVVGTDIAELIGDARKLDFVRCNSLGYIYSSHLLEDFPDTVDVLTCWASKIKHSGYLILYLPNEKIYRKHCEDTGQGYNENHSIPEMSLDYIKDCLGQVTDKSLGHYSFKTCLEIPLHEIYSFCLVVQVLRN